MEENYISVSQINNYIKNIFEAEVLLQNICVYGEVGSFKISNGIAYFNIQDTSGLLSCVLFNANKFETPNVGDMVLVKGSVSYYAKGGKLSFNAYSIEPYGKGMLYEAFLKLKAKLEEKGYFDLAHKKPLPERVKRIGVVSSSTGAVIQDIIDVTRRRNDSIDIVLYPVKVQGLGAENQIAEGINFFSNYENIDVIIVARGGGSMEDLQPFNTEIVADATYNCNKPLISAVGHETDFTIIDFVADLRAPTPSAGAELAAWRKDIELGKILNYADDLEKSIEKKMDKRLSDLNIYNKSLIYNITASVSTIVGKLETLNSKLFTLIDNKLMRAENEVSKIETHLIKLNPKTLASKGYIKVSKAGKVIKTASELSLEDNVVMNFIDGNVQAQVIKKETKKVE